ncbi:decarboxylating cobalt-precorrin-6B (C(15))-methyltransferase [Vagococcus fessus]|uniref:Precorrin-6Y C5,15-methyltransferase (Decarboxylating) subunit CbiT n=1 Tax=Vagococcus fessus TaxID=120370 RepID=A0A430AD23_9ENTE|nr:decarboxylating cobalt-precorrin-6B (C(15))-methyltransferase [Vagococcus fessus]RSU05102.1 precorrin-6Y C5,15-methyltransferase (decarboxylating) subunit CbiT [Vagococcus fessus]
MRDTEFIRDKVPMTKEEVRAISLSKLSLGNANSLLDVGAGTGSVGLQAAFEYPDLEVLGIEQKEIAVDLILKNKTKFNLSNYQVTLGKAPIELRQSFDRIFIGGSGGNLAEIIDWSYSSLTDEGILVLNFILIENALEAMRELEKSKFKELEMVQVGIGDWTKLGKGHYFKPQNQTLIISCQK